MSNAARDPADESPQQRYARLHRALENGMPSTAVTAPRALCKPRALAAANAWRSNPTAARDSRHTVLAAEAS
ncbi:MAG: hypothetical protein FJ301_09700 [Planctomycetes bacterium]|nr:hypothetical protein [Planctomycetota bacterium]